MTISQSHPSVNRREARFKICDHIRQSKAEWKGALLYPQKGSKGLQKLFKAVVNETLQVFNLVQKFLI